jgi:hypothetical protein
MDDSVDAVSGLLIKGYISGFGAEAAENFSPDTCCDEVSLFRRRPPRRSHRFGRDHVNALY